MEFLQQERIFSPEECGRILQLAWHWQASVVAADNEDIVNESIRKSETAYLDGERAEMLEALVLDKLGYFGLVAIPRELQLVRYRPGSFFKVHRDRPVDQSHEQNRVCTLIVQLSPGSDYIGGDLEIEGRAASRERGTVIVFDSGKLHRVRFLCAGVRYSLVCWLSWQHLRCSPVLLHTT